jgi:endo-1,4-beta-xylanase
MISSADKFEEQAQYYSDIMDVIMKYRDSVSAVVFWGTTDDMSWRASKYPLLFNEDYTAKPCFYSIVDGIDYTEATETQAKSTVRGDVNADGVCDVMDVILLQKWLLGIPGTHLADWKAGDLCQDGVLDVFDLCMMKRIVMQ